MKGYERKSIMHESDDIVPEDICGDFEVEYTNNWYGEKKPADYCFEAAQQLPGSIRACLKKVFCEMCIAVTVIFMTSSICYFASGAQLAEQGLSKPGLKA